ncbi:thromboxane-A synthase-like [Oratosquilla oratoria]|uniref:thromboxane-A synthase-like n=1 Tax=Oratosquilla oratoria TaxID=337810 RepID=UPI003F775FB1
MALTLVLVTVFALLAAYWYWERQQYFHTLQNLGYRTPPVHWFFGHYHQVYFRPETKQSIEVKHEWITQIGKIIGYYYGRSLRIIIADLDVLKQVLIKDANKFINRSAVNPRSKMLVSLRDQHWKDVRRIMTPIFSTAKMKKMMTLVEKCNQVFLEEMDKRAESGDEFDVYEVLQCLTLDVIDTCAIAMDLQCIKNPENDVLQMIRRFLQNPMPKFVSLFVLIPASRIFAIFIVLMARLLGGQDSKADHVQVHLKEVIKKRKENPQKYVRQDALQLLLDASTEENSVSAKTKLTEREVVENAFMFVLAGYETTSNALGYTFHLLSVHSDVQDKLFEEINNVVGEKDLTYDDLNALVYTDAVILESMRLYPPIPSFVLREAAQEWTYGNLTIPKGAVVEAPVWSIHHDPEIYPDPEEFRPERFLPKERANRHPLAYLAFGSGPRNCIGARFAMLEAKLTLATTVRRYIIQSCSKTIDPLPTVTRTVLTNPSQGVWVTFKKRV